MSPIRPDDRWLFLTPEVEREVPELLAALGQGDLEQERRRIEAMIHSGTLEGWFAYLRDCRRRLEQAGDGERAARLRAVLLEQYLLVPALREDEDNDAPERRRLEELEWTSR